MAFTKLHDVHYNLSTYRKSEDMPVPDWSMIGMTLTHGKLMGLGNIAREELPAALDER